MASVIFALVAIILLIINISTAVRNHQLEEINRFQSNEVFKQGQELKLVRGQLKEAIEELEALVAKRLPKLTKLAFDTVFPIEQGLVKNIVFTTIGKGGKRKYEYKLVLENNTLMDVKPVVTIYFFSEFGVQVGSAKVPEFKELEPEERSSFSSTLDIFMDEEPYYFYVNERIVEN